MPLTSSGSVSTKTYNRPHEDGRANAMDASDETWAMQARVQILEDHLGFMKMLIVIRPNEMNIHAYACMNIFVKMFRRVVVYNQ